jgi:hypothetical protein
MRLTSNDSEFSEIFIERHKNTPFLMSAGENFVIAWINIPGASPNDVMTSRFEQLDGTTPDARIQQDFHEGDSTGSGSIRS